MYVGSFVNNLFDRQTDSSKKSMIKKRDTQTADENALWRHAYLFSHFYYFYCYVYLFSALFYLCYLCIQYAKPNTPANARRGASHVCMYMVQAFKACSLKRLLQALG